MDPEKRKMFNELRKKQKKINSWKARAGQFGFVAGFAVLITGFMYPFAIRPMLYPELYDTKTGFKQAKERKELLDRLKFEEEMAALKAKLEKAKLENMKAIEEDNRREEEEKRKQMESSKS